MARAKAKGKYKGRKPIAPDRQADVLWLAEQGITKVSIAKRLGVGEATVCRILSAAKAAQV